MPTLDWKELVKDLPRQPAKYINRDLQLFSNHEFALGQILYDLGINLEEHLIGGVLLASEHIAEQKIAAITGIPRSTVRGRIDDAVIMGIAVRTSKGVSLTEPGRRLFALMSNDVAHRAQTGAPLSPLLCDILDNLTLSDGVTRPFKVADRLRSIAAPTQNERSGRQARQTP